MQKVELFNVGQQKGLQMYKLYGFLGMVLVIAAILGTNVVAMAQEGPPPFVTQISAQPFPEGPIESVVQVHPYIVATGSFSGTIEVRWEPSAFSYKNTVCFIYPPGFPPEGNFEFCPPPVVGQNKVVLFSGKIEAGTQLIAYVSLQRLIMAQARSEACVLVGERSWCEGVDLTTTRKPVPSDVSVQHLCGATLVSWNLPGYPQAYVQVQQAPEEYWGDPVPGNSSILLPEKVIAGENIVKTRVWVYDQDAAEEILPMQEFTSTLQCSLGFLPAIHR